MKTIKQIKQLVEIFSTNSDSTSNNSLLTSVRDNYIPLFQFNIEAFSSEKAQLVFEKIGENVPVCIHTPLLHGLDGDAKMSSSKGSYIAVDDSVKEITKKINKSYISESSRRLRPYL